MGTGRFPTQPIPPREEGPLKILPATPTEPDSIRNGAGSARQRFAACVALLGVAFSLGLAPRPAWAQATASPRFGDSTWVAPSYCIEPLREDARVAEPDHERTWETVLRTPFRAVFYPFRLVARGSEQVVAFGSRYVLRPPERVEWLGVRIGPAFGISGTSGPAAGVSLQGHGGLGARSNLVATWSTKDTRKVHFRASVTERSMPLGVEVSANYDYLPNRRFYGMGNDAAETKTIFLRRENSVGLGMHFGADPYRRVFGVVGLSDIHVGPGYRGVPRSQDVFTPEEVPGLGEDSKIIAYGLGGDLAAVDSRFDPTFGLHLRGRVMRDQSVDAQHLDYWDWEGEARAYMPVLSERRVVGLRFVYKGVDPTSDSDEIPFYRMPTSNNEVRFAGFRGNRFVDSQLMLAHAEYRWTVWRQVWATFFLQYGEVQGDADNFTIRDAHRSIGGGFRKRLSPSTSARLEFGHSDEANIVYLDLKGDF